MRNRFFFYNESGKVVFIIGLIAVVSFCLGLLFWPYGAENPFSNPFTALKEMSAYSPEISILFDGNYFWSNDQYLKNGG